MNTIIYQNEMEFKRICSNLEKLNESIYHELVDNYLLALQKGEYIGKKIEKDKYEISLVKDPLFKNIYGPLKLTYRVKNGMVLIIGIYPNRILLSDKKIVSYKEVPIFEDDEQAKSKIDLYLESKNGKKS